MPQHQCFLKRVRFTKKKEARDSPLVADMAVVVVVICAITYVAHALSVRVLKQCFVRWIDKLQHTQHIAPTWLQRVIQMCFIILHADHFAPNPKRSLNMALLRLPLPMGWLLLCLLMANHSIPATALVEDILDVIKLGKEVTSSLLETWDIIEQTHKGNEVDIPFYKVKEKKILSRMAELARQINVVESEV